LEVSATGAKLAPFNLGGVCRIALPKPMMPCSKFLFLATIFPKNEKVENFVFPTLKKRVEKIFRT
jgi:hypothetical protein